MKVFISFFAYWNNICFFPNFWKSTFFQRLLIYYSQRDSSLLQILIIFIDILSQPLALAGSKFFNINDMSSSVKSNDVILALVLYENNGNTLESFVSVLIDAKELLKRFALSQQSEKNLPLTNKGGIAGTFSL